MQPCRKHGHPCWETSLGLDFLSDTLYIRAEAFMIHEARTQAWDIPGGPVVNTSPSSAGVEGSIPGQETKIPQRLMATKPKCKTAAVL